jgi:hypothetical protein
MFPCTWQSYPACLDPQLNFALQGLALDVSDLTRATVKNSALKNVRIQMRPDAPVYRV